MIQRIQSVYLLLTTLTAVLFLAGKIIVFENGASINLAGLEGTTVNPGFFPALTVLFATVPLFAFIIIFLYRNRKLQLRLIMLEIFLILAVSGVLVWLSDTIISGDQTSVVLTYKLALPLIMLLLCILAYAGVRKDERIVRSYDRLR